MRYTRRSKNKKLQVPEVSLTPLIDTALTLLIIFMIATPMMNNIIKVELPSTKTDEGPVQEQDEVVIFIDKNKKLYMNDKKMSLDQALKALQKIGKQKKESIVFVKADQAVSYGKVIELVDTIKTVGGIKYVALATKRAL